LDFVTLNMNENDLKKKILLFNEIFQIIPLDSINQLSHEIHQLTQQDLFTLRKKAKKSSLYLWNLIQETCEDYKLLDKIFRTAHALPTSSAPIEQTFSTLKLIRDENRTSLLEETCEGLIIIHEKYQNEEIKISNLMMEKFNQIREELIGRKTKQDQRVQESMNEEKLEGKSKEREEEKIEELESESIFVELIEREEEYLFPEDFKEEIVERKYAQKRKTPESTQDFFPILKKDKKMILDDYSYHSLNSSNLKFIPS